MTLSVVVVNAGDEPLPVGIGWHPYFRIPSGRREQAQLSLPARRRALVTNYDDVFPTGALASVAGTPYDLTAAGGRPLGAQYFDDCFVDLMKSPEGDLCLELFDPATAFRLRLIATSPHVQAVQVYAPPDEAFVVLEPQFNRADPFSPVWPRGTDTGMVVVPPGEDVTWAVQLDLL